MRVRIDRKGIERLGPPRVGFAQRLVHLAPQQAPSLHERATDGVLEILDFVAVGRPVDGVGVRHAEQGHGVSQPLGIVPCPTVGVPVGVTARATDPPPAHHRFERGVEQPLAFQLLGGQGGFAHGDLRHPLVILRVVDPQVEVERVVDVALGPVGREPHGTGVVTQPEHAPKRQFAVVVVEHLRDEGVVGPGKDRHHLLSIGRDGGFPGVRHHERPHEGIHGEGLAAGFFARGEIDDRDIRQHRPLSLVDGDPRADMGNIRLPAGGVEHELAGQVLARRALPAIADLARLEVDRDDGGGKVLGHVQAVGRFGEGEPPAHRTGGEPTKHLAGRHIDLGDFARVLLGDPEAGSRAVRDDTVGLVEERNRPQFGTTVGVEEGEAVVGVDRHRQLMSVPDEADTLGLVTDRQFAEDLAGLAVDDGDSAVVAIGAGDEPAIGGDVEQAVGRARQQRGGAPGTATRASRDYGDHRQSEPDQTSHLWPRCCDDPWAACPTAANLNCAQPTIPGVPRGGWVASRFASRCSPVSAAQSLRGEVSVQASARHESRH